MTGVPCRQGPRSRPGRWSDFAVRWYRGAPAGNDSRAGTRLADLCGGLHRDCLFHGAALVTHSNFRRAPSVFHLLPCRVDGCSATRLRAGSDDDAGWRLTGSMVVCQPQYSFNLQDVEGWAGLALFYVVGTNIALVSESWHRARETADLGRRRMQEVNGELQRRVTELQTLLNVIPVGIAIADDPGLPPCEGESRLAKMLGASPTQNVLLASPKSSPRDTHCFRGDKQLDIGTPSSAGRRHGTIGPGRRDRTAAGFHRADDHQVSPRHLFPDEQGRSRGAVAAILDVTERRRVAEELLEAKEQAEAANGARASFSPISVTNCERR
jgi:PAS domain-containing protein